MGYGMQQVHVKRGVACASVTGFRPMAAFPGNSF